MALAAAGFVATAMPSGHRHARSSTIRSTTETVPDQFVDGVTDAFGPSIAEQYGRTFGC